MKAKKIIAIGLVAAMTLGMSTSVMATALDYTYYGNAPVFDQFEKDYGPYDNVFHEEGQGWLESGKGLNEGTINVIVPTRPTFTRAYGDPDIFDFGVDPQRLVTETEGIRYKDSNGKWKVYFPTAATDAGLYFINPASTNPYSPTGEEDQYLKGLNWYNNESVRYTATNIGTEDLEFYVEATLTGANDFKILEKAPEASQSAYEKFDALWAYAYSETANDNVGYIWKNSAIVQAYRTEDQRVKNQFLKDLVDPDVPYLMLTTKTKAGVFVKDETKDQWTVIANALEEKYYDSKQNEKTGAEVLKAAAAADEFDAELKNWKTISTQDVGMYMTLNMGTLSENALNEPAKKPENPVARPFASVGSTSNAAVMNHLTVKGNPENYKRMWDAQSQSYRYVMKPDRNKPFQQVAFWFAGQVTNNDEVSADVEVPVLDLTWRISKETGEKVEPTVLTSINFEDVPATFAYEFNSDDEFYSEEGIVLGFDNPVQKVMYSADGETWKNYTKGGTTYYTIDEDSLLVKTRVFTDVNNSQTDRIWKVFFDNGEEEDSMMFVFSPVEIDGQD